MAKLVSNTYGDALFELALEENKIDSLQEEVVVVLEALAENFGWELDIPQADTPLKGAEDVTLESIMASYNPLFDTSALKSSPTSFENLRNTYNFRSEPR